MDFFLKLTFSKNLSVIQSECQTVWIQIRPDETQTFCRAWSGSKLFAKAISRWQKSPQSGKELKCSVKITPLQLFVCLFFFFFFQEATYLPRKVQAGWNPLCWGAQMAQALVCSAQIWSPSTCHLSNFLVCPRQNCRGIKVCRPNVTFIIFH